MKLEFDVPSNRFLKMMMDNDNWFIDYYNWLLVRTIEEYGDKKIRDLPFYFHVSAIIDNEFVHKAFGNLDADL